MPTAVGDRDKSQMTSKAITAKQEPQGLVVQPGTVQKMILFSVANFPMHDSCTWGKFFIIYSCKCTQCNFCH